MAVFTASPIVDPGVDPAQADAFNQVQRNSLLNVGVQQDQANQAAFRANAGGLIARDPTATATALGANPAAAQAYLSSIPLMDQDTREQAQSDIGASSSLAGAILNLPPDQRAAAWTAGRQTLIAGGHRNVPPSEAYPGDNAMLGMRALGLTAQQQFEQTGVVPSTHPQPPLMSIPGGASPVAPTDGSAPVAGGGVTATPLAAPGAAAPLAPYDAALMGSESSGRPGIVNSEGYAGLYQFGTGRLNSLGMYTPAAGENLKTNEWRGTISIPGYPQVKTLADFRANPAAQQAVQQASNTDLDASIAQTPGADKFDPAGLRAVAHLGGTDAMQHFVQSGGQFSRADSNGTSLAAYYRKFAGMSTAAPAPDGGGAPAQVAGGQQPPAPSGQAAAGSPFVVGDSLGVGIAQNNGLQSSAQEKINPTAVLGRINALPAGSLAGRLTIISTGVSNDTSQIGTVQQQIDAARARGATDIRIIGVGSRPDLAPMNPRLQSLAAANGATFVPISAGPDQVHPTGAGYRGLGLTAPAARSGQPVRLANNIQPGVATDTPSPMISGIGPETPPPPGSTPSPEVIADSQRPTTPAPPAGQPGAFGGGYAPAGGDPQPPRSIAAPSAAPPTANALAAIGKFGPNVPDAGVRIDSDVPGANPAVQGGSFGRPIALTTGAPNTKPGGPLVGQVAQNPLAGLTLGTPSPPNALLGVGQPAPGVQGAPAAPAALPGTVVQQTQPATRGMAPAQPAPGPVPNALSGIGAGASTQPNPLAPAGQPQPGQPGAPMPSAAQAQPPAAPGGPPPGFLPLRMPKTGAFVPGAQPGFILYRNDATGETIAQREPGTQPKLVFTNVGGTLIGSDPDTGRVVSQTRIGNTGRLVAAPDGNGGTQFRDPNGNVVANGPSNTGHELSMADYTRDQTVAQSAAEELGQAKQTDFAIREQRGITQGLSQTGAFGDRKAALASYLESTFSPTTAKAFENAAGLDDASMSQLFAKTAIQASGQQENANVGARGGFGLTNLYLKANPGLQTQPTAIRDVQNLQAVSNLAQQDYLTGLLGHITTNGAAFHDGGNYTPSTQFSLAWNSGNNPQVYVAAAEALNQQPYEKWSRGLSDQNKTRALSIAARADNTGRYVGPNGPAALTPYGMPQGGSGAPAAAPTAPAASAQPTSVPPAAAAYLRQNPALAAQFDQKYGQGASRGVLGQ